jgi:hypothetical protein
MTKKGVIDRRLSGRHRQGDPVNGNGVSMARGKFRCCLVPTYPREVGPGQLDRYRPGANLRGGQLDRYSRGAKFTRVFRPNSGISMQNFEESKIDSTLGDLLVNSKAFRSF